MGELPQGDRRVGCDGRRDWSLAVVFLFPTITLVGTLIMVAASAVVYGVILVAIGGVDSGVMLLLRRRLGRLTGGAA